jgi:hypothetical protein
VTVLPKVPAAPSLPPLGGPGAAEIWPAAALRRRPTFPWSHSSIGEAVAPRGSRAHRQAHHA